MKNGDASNLSLEKYKRHATDVGSPEVQIAMATQRIAELSKHLKTHSKDKHSAMGLYRLVEKRKSLSKYLKKTDPKTYHRVISDLGLRK